MEKFSRRKIILTILYFICFLGIIPIIVYFINNYLFNKQLKYINKFQFNNKKDIVINIEDNDYTFKCNNPKIMQLSDIHLGCGIFSYKKDRLAIDTIIKMILTDKPDLVIITGDISYPVWIIVGAVSNLRCFILLDKLFSSLNTYFSFTFGNHDNEIYCINSKEEIAKYLSNNKSKYCLFNHNYKVDGINQFIKIITSNNELIKLLILLDTHSYTKTNFLGVKENYDYIKDNQIKLVINKIKRNNNIKSLLFIHIPIHEYRYAYKKYIDNEIQLIGNIKSRNKYKNKEYTLGISTSFTKVNIFDELTKLNSLEAVFCGHDHKNDLVMNYKGVILSYCKPIDYIAYFNLINETHYRGCNIINLIDKKVTNKVEDYYQYKYQKTNLNKYQKK